jgi:SAM-dependent methyltransferase
VTPRALRRAAFRFREARALFAGVELGVFAALASAPRTAAELAGELELDARGAAMLLDALVAMQALARHGQTYSLAPALRAVLAPGEPGFVGNLLLHDLWHWSTWARLDRAVREGASQVTHAGDPHLGDPAILRRFLPNYVAAMDQSGTEAFAPLAARIVRDGAKRALDLGAGSGGLAEALLAAPDGPSVTLIDHPFALGLVSPLLRGSSRVELLARDLEKDPLPGDFDAVVLSRVLMGFAPARAAEAVAKAAGSLAAGGRLYVHDFARDSRVGALLGLDMLLNTGGEAHSDAAVRGWLAGAGLAVESAEALTPYTRLWVARRT